MCPEFGASAFGEASAVGEGGAGTTGTSSGVFGATVAGKATAIFGAQGGVFGAIG